MSINFTYQSWTRFPKALLISITIFLCTPSSSLDAGRLNEALKLSIAFKVLANYAQYALTHILYAPLDDPLLDAIVNDQPEALRLLVAVDPEAITTLLSWCGDTYLHTAVVYGQVKAVMILVQANPECTAIKNNDGLIPLHGAAKDGSNEIVMILLEADPESMATQTESGNTPLHFAAGFGTVETVKLLMKHNPPLNTRNNDGETSLQVAQRSGHHDIGTLLQ